MLAEYAHRKANRAAMFQKAMIQLPFCCASTTIKATSSSARKTEQLMATRQQNGTGSGKTNGHSPDEPKTAKSPDALPPSLFAGPFAPLMQGPMRDMIALQSQAAQQMMDAFFPSQAADEAGDSQESHGGDTDWDDIVTRLTQMWQDFARENPATAASGFADPSRWMELAGQWMARFTPAESDAANRAFSDTLALWETMIGQFMAAGSGPDKLVGTLPLPGPTGDLPIRNGATIRCSRCCTRPI